MPAIRMRILARDNPTAQSDPTPRAAHSIGRPRKAIAHRIVAQRIHVDEHYPPPPAPAASYPPYAPQEPGYDNEAPAGSRFFSGPAAQFNGFRDDDTVSI